MTNKNERPVFLTVLCILTFIGAGLTLIGQLISLATKPLVEASTVMVEESMTDAMDAFSSSSSGFSSLIESFMGQGMKALENYTELILVRVIGTLVLLFGALLMWKLKKTGFFLFVGGKAFIIIAVFIIMGATGMAFLSVVGTLFVAIAFSIMYAVNLKHMQ